MYRNLNKIDNAKKRMSFKVMLRVASILNLRKLKIPRYISPICFLKCVRKFVRQLFPSVNCLKQRDRDFSESLVFVRRFSYCVGVVGRLFELRALHAEFYLWCWPSSFFNSNDVTLYRLAFLSLWWVLWGTEKSIFIYTKYFGAFFYIVFGDNGHSLLDHVLHFSGVSITEHVILFDLTSQCQDFVFLRKKYDFEHVHEILVFADLEKNTFSLSYDLSPKKKVYKDDDPRDSFLWRSWS